MGAKGGTIYNAVNNKELLKIKKDEDVRCGSGESPSQGQDGHKLWTSTSQEHWEVEHHLRQHQGMPRPVHVVSVSFDLQSHKRPGLSIPLLS